MSTEAETKHDQQPGQQTRRPDVDNSQLNTTLSRSHTESDANLYASKVETLRLRLQECDLEVADAEKNIAGWTKHRDNAKERRVNIERQLRATRIAQRALEDAVDGI